MLFERNNATRLTVNYDPARRALLNNKASTSQRFLLSREERTGLAASLALYGPASLRRDHM
jgi:hypothetical protein